MNELISLFKLYDKQSYSERYNFNLQFTTKSIYNYLRFNKTNNINSQMVIINNYL